MKAQMTKTQLIDNVNDLYRLAFQMGRNSYLLLPHSKVAVKQLENMRINLLGAYELLRKEQELEAEAAAKYPEMAKHVLSVIGYIPDTDPIQAAWTAAYTQRTGLFMQDWKNSVVIESVHSV